MGPWGKEILITGGTGLAGSCAVSELSYRGIPLRVLARSVPPGAAVPGALIPGARFCQGDLRPPAALQELAAENSGIVHYACASLREQADPQIDIDAMKALLRTWKHGPLVYISSIDVYGSPSIHQVPESHPLNGRMGPYAKGKIECERLIIEEARKRSRQDFTIFRAPWIFAPNRRSREHIVSRFLEPFGEGDIVLPGETEMEWEELVDTFVDARDLAWLVAEALKRPLGGAGNVVGATFTWHDFFEQLRRSAGTDRRIVHRARGEVPPFSAELFGQTCSYSGDRVTQHFGFQPRFTLADSLTAAFSA
jgi:nucleoside-diphosphate-sugar epimerase